MFILEMWKLRPRGNKHIFFSCAVGLVPEVNAGTRQSLGWQEGGACLQTAVVGGSAHCLENYGYHPVQILRIVKFLLAGGFRKTSWRR